MNTPLLASLLAVLPASQSPSTALQSDVDATVQAIGPVSNHTQSVPSHWTIEQSLLLQDPWSTVQVELDRSHRHSFSVAVAESAQARADLVTGLSQETISNGPNGFVLWLQHSGPLDAEIVIDWVVQPRCVGPGRCTAQSLLSVDVLGDGSLEIDRAGAAQRLVVPIQSGPGRQKIEFLTETMAQAFAAAGGTTHASVQAGLFIELRPSANCATTLESPGCVDRPVGAESTLTGELDLVVPGFQPGSQGYLAFGLQPASVPLPFSNACTLGVDPVLIMEVPASSVSTGRMRVSTSPATLPPVIRVQPVEANFVLGTLASGGVYRFGCS